MDIRCKRAYYAPSADDGQGIPVAVGKVLANTNACRLTLAYGAKDEEPDNAVALREYLREEIRD